MARRAEGILRFVESYREFAQAPEVHRRQFKAKPWAEEIMRLALANAAERDDRRPAIEVEPKTLSLNADPELLAQVAAQSTAQCDPGDDRCRPIRSSA